MADHTELRYTLINQGIRGLVLINGGGATALAIWLRFIWDKPDSEAAVIAATTGIKFLVVGLVLAAMLPFVRYLESLHPNTFTPLKNPWWYVFVFVMWLPALLFAIGMWIAASGVTATCTG